MKEFWVKRYKTLFKKGTAGCMSLGMNESVKKFIGDIKKNLTFEKKCDLLIDYGCGTGKLTKFLKEHFNAKRYIGYDIIEEVIAFNKKEHKEDFRLVNGEMEKGSDVIWCSFLLQHMGEQEMKNILFAFRRSLKKNGRAYIVNAVCKGQDTGNMFHRSIPEHLRIFEEADLKSKVIFTTFIGSSEVACFEVSK